MSPELAVIIIAVLILIYLYKNSRDGFADRLGAPIGLFSTGGGIYLDDVHVARDTVWGGKGGRNEFIGGCCSIGGCGKCALSVNESGSVSSGISVADNSSKLDYADFGAEPDVMNNMVGAAYLSPTPYSSEGANLIFAGDPYMPPYSEYEPPLF